MAAKPLYIKKVEIKLIYFDIFMIIKDQVREPTYDVNMCKSLSPPNISSFILAKC